MPDDGDPYQDIIELAAVAAGAGTIESTPLPDVGLGVLLTSIALHAWSGAATVLQLYVVRSPEPIYIGRAEGTALETFLPFSVKPTLEVGAFVRGLFDQGAIGDVDLTVNGFWQASLIPPPPPLGAWCEPFPPVDGETVDELITAHAERMEALWDGTWAALL